MKQKKIFFLFGGPGAEHEVSLATAKSALPNFDESYQVSPVFISKDKQWSFLKGFVAPADAWDRAIDTINKPGVPAEIAIEYMSGEAPFVVFLGLHGQFGEDGTVQLLLESHGLAYTGSDPEASALAMDKPKVLQILQDEAITVPDFLEVTAETSQEDMEQFINYVALPVVVLPADSGSSVGVTIIRELSQLSDALVEARSLCDRVLITKYIPGREVSSGVLVTGVNELTSLPPTELIPTPGHEFFDYDAKYTPGATNEITPPDMPEETIEKIKSIAKRVHHLVEADGYSRTDMIVGTDGEIYVLEINTLPGLTQTSILPQQALEYGLSFRALLTTICEHADRSSNDFITAVD